MIDDSSISFIRIFALAFLMIILPFLGYRIYRWIVPKQNFSIVFDDISYSLDHITSKQVESLRKFTNEQRSKEKVE